METRFIRLVGCALPVQQAGTGEAATVDQPAAEIVRELVEGIG